MREEETEAGGCYTLYGPVTGFARGWVCAGREGKQAHLHSLTKSGRVPAILSALAARLRGQPIEFAVETVAVRGRGGRVAAPDRK